jgi:HAMP domain-containing protein
MNTSRLPTEGSGHNPETVHLRRLRTITRVMDEAFRVPGTRFRFGLDGLAGFIPGLGDAITAGIAGYALLAAARTGAPLSVLARMAGNILLDTLAGTVPVLGDVFDLGFKANRRNLRILEQYANAPEHTRRASRGMLAAAAGLVALVIVGAIALAVWAGSVLLRVVG